MSRRRQQPVITPSDVHLSRRIEIAHRDADDCSLDFRVLSTAHYRTPAQLALLLVPAPFPDWIVDPSLLPKRPPGRAA